MAGILVQHARVQGWCVAFRARALLGISMGFTTRHHTVDGAEWNNMPPTYPWKIPWNFFGLGFSGSLGYLPRVGKIIEEIKGNLEPQQFFLWLKILWSLTMGCAAAYPSKASEESYPSIVQYRFAGGEGVTVEWWVCGMWNVLRNRIATQWLGRLDFWRTFWWDLIMGSCKYYLVLTFLWLVTCNLQLHASKRGDKPVNHQSSHHSILWNTEIWTNLCPCRYHLLLGPFFRWRGWIQLGL